MRIRRAYKDDWKILLEWRNDKQTRKNSINSNLVSEEEHKRWFYDSLKSKDRGIYLVVEGTELVGTLRVDYVKNKKIISWTVAPRQRGKGFAKKMVKMLADSLGGKLEAIVKEENHPSIKVAEYAGFALIEKKEGLFVFNRINNENS